MDEFPRLRYLEPMIVNQDGGPLALIRDPEELGSGMMVVELPTLMIMSMFDGGTSLRDVQAAATAAFSQIIPMEQLESLVGQLDEQYLLENAPGAAAPS